VAIESLEKLPPNLDVHVWADYVELLAMANVDGEVSRSDLVDRIKERRSIDPGADEAAAPDAPVVEPVSDTLLARADEIFRHLAYRQGAFGASYPFRISPKGVLIRAGRMTSSRRLYVFLLLASALRYTTASSRGSVTKDFERLSRDAIAAWLPRRAQVHIFGTSAAWGSRYHGQLFRKLTKLASDLSERLLLDEEDLRSGDHGDAGADIVAWLAVGDENRSRLIVLAQATCEMDWTAKQHQSAAPAWRPLMQFAAEPANVLLIPYCYRKGDGNWFMNRTIQNTILFDRLRLTRIVDGDRVLTPRAAGIVTEALAFRERLD
jgi:hypothetical protein